MTTEPSSPATRYLTLRDYLRVVRRYWIMIAAITALGGAAAYVVVSRQKPVYKASSEVVFQDPGQAPSLAGVAYSTPQGPAQLAATNAQTATGGAVMRQVKHQLKSKESASALAGAITTQVEPQSALLLISATGQSPHFASNLANAVASVVVSQDNQHTRAQFAQVADAIRHQLAQLPRGPAANPPNPNGPANYYQNQLARMNTLASFAESAQVAKLASTPGAPSSPHRATSVLLGLALGLLLGIVAAFFRDTLDRRLRNPQDIDSSFRLPLLGYVGKRSMGRVVYMPNGRRAKRQVDLEQFKILRRNVALLNPENPPRSIVVTSTVSGEGKTTVASSLAFAMAAAGKRTLLVDCDLRRPALADRLRIENAPGISEYLAGTASPEEILRTVEFSEPHVLNGSGNGNGTASVTSQRLVCIPSGHSTPRAPELLGSARFKEFVEQVAETYDAVVLDSAPLLSIADTLEMLPHVDAVVVCVRESRTTRGQALAARATLARVGGRPAGIVVTGVRPGAGEEIYSYSYGYA